MKPFHIAEPCNASWDAMRNDGASRHCASCDKRVFDLGAMTERQIRGLTLVSGGTFCGRQTIRQGDLVTTPEPAAVRKTSALWPIRVLAAAGAISAAACGTGDLPMVGAIAYVDDVGRAPTPTAPTENTSAPPSPTPPPEPEHMLAGEIAYVPTLPSEITFVAGSAKLDQNAKNLLGTAADFLRGQPDTVAVVIEGDALVSETKPADKLALARAEAVKKHLVSLGVKATRLHVRASKPMTPQSVHPEAVARARSVHMRICEDATCK